MISIWPVHRIAISFAQGAMVRLFRARVGTLAHTQLSMRRLMSKARGSSTGRTQYVRQRTESGGATSIMARSWNSVRQAHNAARTLPRVQGAPAAFGPFAPALGRHQRPIARRLLIGSIGIQRSEVLVRRAGSSRGDPPRRAV